MKKILLFILLFLNLFLVGCNNPANKLDSGTIVPFELEYIKDKTDYRYNYSDNGYNFIDDIIIEFNVKGYKDLTYFNCAVNLLVKYYSLEEDGKYKINEHKFSNIYIGPYGNYYEEFTIHHECRYVKNMYWVYEKVDIPSVIKKAKF